MHLQKYCNTGKAVIAGWQAGNNSISPGTCFMLVFQPVMSR